MKYKLPDLNPNITKIDVLVFCSYCISVKREKYKNDRITLDSVMKSLTRYDYKYESCNPNEIKTVLIKLFPLHKNNHRHIKYFKISRNLINYWGIKFKINYNLHKESYSVFKHNYNERTMSF